mmetsp:Transcript_12095/g.52109  ORF Transcript_12095/g.52109 Transcript_12095/m.52109 type:complete len:390 (-) Transcript_12095:71-1240(-)
MPKDSPGKGIGEDEFFAAESTRASEEVERVTSGIELEREASKTFGSDTAILPRLLDASGVLQDAASAIIDDTFNACFAFSDNTAWNWNFYLFPLWCFGVALRYLVLFPIRLTWIVTCTLLFILFFTIIHNVTRGKLRANLERDLVHLYAACFVISWTGVIKYHGPKPTQRSGHVYVANHTSIIDYIVLTQVTPFSSIAQQNKGWVGFIQNTAMDAIHCIRFNRTESKDREMVQRRLREHVANPDRLPLLIFPEGTCVNNEYCVMFKKGAFDLGCKVCPIAIKYNKIFAETFWHSRRMSFTTYLMKLMTSWAVVADVWYMEPQEMGPDEDSIQFAERVRGMICERAGIKPVPWDGMLKYYRPSPKMTEKRRAQIASNLVKLLPPKDGHLD